MHGVRSRLIKFNSQIFSSTHFFKCTCWKRGLGVHSCTPCLLSAHGCFCQQRDCVILLRNGAVTGHSAVWGESKGNWQPFDHLTRLHARMDVPSLIHHRLAGFVFSLFARRKRRNFAENGKWTCCAALLVEKHAETCTHCRVQAHSLAHSMGVRWRMSALAHLSIRILTRLTLIHSLTHIVTLALPRSRSQRTKTHLSVSTMTSTQW